MHCDYCCDFCTLVHPLMRPPAPSPLRLIPNDAVSSAHQAAALAADPTGPTSFNKRTFPLHIVLCVPAARVVLPRYVLACVGVDSHCEPWDTAALLSAGHWELSLNASHAAQCVKRFTLPPREGRPWCPLRKLSAHAARELLKDKHLVLIGDSVTRHQYGECACVVLPLRRCIGAVCAGCESLGVRCLLPVCVCN